MKRHVMLLLLAVLPLMAIQGREEKGNSKGNAQETVKTLPTNILYDEDLSVDNQPADLLLEDVKASYSPEGLTVEAGDGRVRLGRYYSLGHRSVRYVVRMGEGAIGTFFSDVSMMPLVVDVAAHRIAVETNPQSWKQVDWLVAGEEYLVEVEYEYHTNLYSIISLRTGQQVSIRQTSDGPGGYAAGAVGSQFTTSAHRDYYCFAARQGSFTVSHISVIAGACDLTLLLYGDSITDPGDYCPQSEFSQNWTQLIMGHVKGRAMASGRGGTNVPEIMLRIRNELPYVKAKYVMVTIGTNNGNTEENLCELVEYILSQGSIPILNNIPCNEENDQVAKNAVIDKVRKKYGIRGCRFDVATSLNRDGMQLDASTMYFENLREVYGKDFYHHPNVKGSRLMFLQTLVDIPEIYDGL